jgi:lipopolysaccharide biosynthesis glycosyltransferase
VPGDIVNIVFCCDDKFAEQLQVAALSVAINASRRVAIHVIDCGISEENRSKILSIGKLCQNIVNVTLRQPTRERAFEECPIPEYFSSAVFYRLAIPKIFPELQRAIYVDCDVVVDGDVSELWLTNLEGHAFAALNEEGNFYLPEDMAGRKARAGIPQERVYMCSGVLLIDGKRFEEAKIFERVLEFIKTSHGPLSCPEQDAMNICLGSDEYLPLSPKFNFTPFAPLAKHRLKDIKKPVIIHYSWGKPWIFNRKVVHAMCGLGLCRYSFGFIKKYWEYADRIPGGMLSSERKIPTYYFVYKRLFGAVEHFVAKKIRNGLIRLCKRMLPSGGNSNGKR